MSKYYVACEDKGPSGPCGQITSVTSPRKDLYIFDDEESARLFITKVEKCGMGKVTPKIIGFWSKDMGNVRDE